VCPRPRDPGSTPTNAPSRPWTRRHTTTITACYPRTISKLRQKEKEKTGNLETDKPQAAQTRPKHRHLPAAGRQNVTNKQVLFLKSIFQCQTTYTVKHTVDINLMRHSSLTLTVSALAQVSLQGLPYEFAIVSLAIFIAIGCSQLQLGGLLKRFNPVRLIRQNKQKCFSTVAMIPLCVFSV